MGFTGFDWVLLGFIGFYWVLLGFTGFYWVLLGFIGFNWALPCFEELNSRVLSCLGDLNVAQEAFTEFDWGTS